MKYTGAPDSRQAPPARPVVLAMNQSTRQHSGPLSLRDWVVVPEVIGIAARVAVWSGVFCLLLFGLFTYAAPLVGAFVLAVLLARYVGR